jgi:hypothetical protein
MHIVKLKQLPPLELVAEQPPETVNLLQVAQTWGLRQPIPLQQQVNFPLDKPQ